MDKHKVWSTLDKVEQGKYLYHYTTYETALKILFFKTLRFSKLSATNDAFEQKPKVKLDSEDLALRQMFTQLHTNFEKNQSRIRILCFSMDPIFDKHKKQYQEMSSFFSKDMIRENVNGRGFALPRSRNARMETCHYILN